MKQVLLTFLPRFDCYENGKYIGSIQKKISFFKPHFEIVFNDWSISGNIFEWDNDITSASGQTIATVSKELLNFTDTYAIKTADDNDALYALMVTLAIEAEKCSRNN